MPKIKKNKKEGRENTLNMLLAKKLHLDGILTQGKKKKEEITKEVFTICAEDYFTKKSKVKIVELEGQQVRIELQETKKITEKDDIVELLREKLGEQLDMYVYTEEKLHTGAIEQLLKEELLTKEDLEDLVNVEKGQKRIIKKIK